MKKNIAIIHYNTPYLTECLVRSINLFVKDANIYIFDNSDKLPFVAKFDNVKIFDNTKGQIINFNEWLKKYPNRIKSPGKANQWGSAKHCYSVEKCMELIKENFILLDSDVLLKRDISNLFIDKYVYIGETVTQPSSTVKRILPFLCFINVDLCKKNHIHYFDDRYMHGLFNTRKYSGADRYDTGGGFYMNASKYPHLDIKLGEYIVHYGHGSWDKKGYKPQYGEKEWAKINKKYWSMEKNKKVIYTCITGGYDSIIEPTYVTADFDYICFTDNTSIKSNVWEIRPLPKETEGLSQVKQQRFVKINPHLFLSEYDLSIWVDGNVGIESNLNEFLRKTLKDDISVYVPKHPSRDCIYKEARVVIAMGKDKAINVNPQVERYKQEGFPKSYGLLQSNIMLRKHNNEDCIRLMEDWFKEIKNGSHRDQLSFNYACWKNKDIKISYLEKNIYNSTWFHWYMSHSKKKNKQVTSIKVKPVTPKKKTIQELKEEFKKIIERKRSLKTQDIGVYLI